jgi:hypothetical protein
MDKPRPYVTAALLCEKVLQEKDEAITLVRIADRIQYRIEAIGEGAPKDLKPIINIQGLVSLKSGPITGDYVVKIILEKPNGDRKEVFAQPLKFLGGDQGPNIILGVALGVDQNGLHWMDVVFDDELLTRVPLMIIPSPEQMPTVQKT